LADVEAVGQVDQVDSPDHDDDDADRSDALQYSEKNGQASGKLTQANQITKEHRQVLICSKAFGTRAAKGSKENAAAVVENGQRTGYAQDQKSET
jgi:hypothetical protein